MTTMGGGMMGMGSFGLTTLLSQMDGMNEFTRSEKLRMKIAKKLGRKFNPARNWHVMWMGSTNRPDATPRR